MPVLNTCFAPGGGTAGRPAMSVEMQRVRRVYRRLAPAYDRSAARWDWLIKLDAGRRWVCDRARGRVLEVGIGTGLSLQHYAPDVELVGVDATPEMLARARQRAGVLRREVNLQVGDAHALRFTGDSFDAVVFTYSLCTIPDPERALQEAWRVMRRGGNLLLTEHVRSPNAVVRTGQRLLNPLFERLEADHLLREPLAHVRALGFVVEELERSQFGVIERLRGTKPKAD